MGRDSRLWDVPALSQPDYEDLRRILLGAAQLMSREQMIELADELFDQARERRRPASRFQAHGAPTLFG